MVRLSGAGWHQGGSGKPFSRVPAVLNPMRPLASPEAEKIICLGAAGGWLGLCAEIIAGALILWWRLERRRWKAAAILSREALLVR